MDSVSTYLINTQQPLQFYKLRESMQLIQHLIKKYIILAFGSPLMFYNRAVTRFYILSILYFRFHWQNSENSWNSEYFPTRAWNTVQVPASSSHILFSVSLFLKCYSVTKAKKLSKA